MNSWYEFTIELVDTMNSYTIYLIHASNRANQHAHFPGLAVAYAASIRRALNYDLPRYTIPSDSVQTLQLRL
jgi:hypothetical protein